MDECSAGARPKYKRPPRSKRVRESRDGPNSLVQALAPRPVRDSGPFVRTDLSLSHVRQTLGRECLLYRGRPLWTPAGQWLMCDAGTSPTEKCVLLTAF